MRGVSYLLTIFASVLLASCQRAPEIAITSPTSIEFSEVGSSGTITFTANRDWAVSWSDSWVSVSPSSGSASKDPVTLMVRCGANTTYDDRSATVTIKAEDITQTITVKQPANEGIVLPTQSFILASVTKSLEVTVQANVQYSVSISEKWVKQTGTKGLTSSTLTFSIEENTTYDARSATITLKPQSSKASEQVISIRQTQKDAIIVEKSNYDMPYGGGEIEEKVEANVSFDVAPGVDWIHHVETKALTTSTVRLKVDENTTFRAREGTVVIKQKNGPLSHTVTVKQACFIPVNSIILDVSTATIAVGDELLLKATIEPSNATDKTTRWETSDASIATVDSEGRVMAVKKGHVIITAKAGNYSASCSVYVRAADYPTPSGAVDLGLSVVWAEKNLGASTASEAGDYYLWGDPTGTGTIMFFTSPNTNSICDTQYDIAKAKLGKGWRLPTREEIKELFSSCSWEKTANGVRLTGPSGKSMTIPLSGMAFPADGAMGTTKLSSTDKGYLMTGESYADGNGRFAYVYYFGQDFSYNWASWNAPMAKFPVRPVFESLDGSIPVSSISLNKTELSLKEGESETLTATVLPADATDKSVTWSSSDTNIATVDQFGKVVAIAYGTATISATADGKEASCSLTILAVSSFGEREYQQQCKRLDDNDQLVFHTLLSDMCSQELWSARDMYDACSWLMVPMHYAFKSGDDYAIKQFHKLFSGFTCSYLNGGDNMFNESSRTNRLQWLYLCSQYLALSSSFEPYSHLFIRDLLSICIAQASDNLYRTQATWKTERTVEEHLKQVLGGKKYKYHYYSLITDGDGFSLAILNDAVYVSKLHNLPITYEVHNAANLSHEIYNSPLLNTETEDGGWLFQVGVGQDYKDFIYAGNTEITEDMQPNPREDIVSDVSHFRRNAFFLTSHLSAQESDEGKAIFRLRLQQLGVQLKKCIVRVEGNWVQTSFMDGSNGVYRYEYHEEGVGHSNYSHSASLIQGWWTALYESWIFDVYKEILEGFPWPQDETNPYWDIITVREQNPYFDCDTAWERGWYKCVIKCAIQLSER